MGMYVKFKVGSVKSPHFSFKSFIMRHAEFSTGLLLLLLLCSCRGSAPQNSAEFRFDKRITLRAEKIRIDEIIKPVGITLLDDYLIVEGEAGMNRDLFYVYSRDKFRYLYSFGVNGRGPNEFLMPTVVQQAPGNNFLVFDNPTSWFYSYDLTDSGALLNVKYRIDRKRESTPMQAIAYVNDSVVMYNLLSHESVRLNTLNLKTSSIIDSLHLESGFKETMGGLYNPNVDSFHFDYKEGLVVLACRYVDEMVFTSIDSAFRFAVGEIELKHTDFVPDKRSGKNVNYYVFTSVGDDYVYTQRYGKPLRNLQPFNLVRDFSFSIEVLTRQKEPVAMLEFDNNMLRFLVDEENRCLYSWDPLANFESIDRYSLDALYE